MKKIFFTTFSIMFALLLTISCAKPEYTAFADNVDTQDKASVVMDFHTGEIVYEKNADEKLQVASIVKLMTSLITIEHIESGKLGLDDKLVASENASSMGGSQAFIDPYSEYSISDMLKSVIVASANDSAVALAEHIAGSEEEFVKMMNKRASELGLTNTIYANSTGLPMPEEYSCAKDVAILLREIIKHETYHKFSTIWIDELVHPSGRKTELVNTNKLTRYYEGCDSGKTGFTDEAGYCLSASAKKGDMRFIAVSLGAKDAKTRFSNVTKLLNFGFANFENKLIVNNETVLAQLNVDKSKTKQLSVYASEKFYGLSRKGYESNYETIINLPNSIQAPVKSGDKVGTITVSKNGNVVKEIDLVVNDSAEKLTYKDAIFEVVENWY